MKYIKEIITVKKSINELIDENHLVKSKLAEDCGIDRLTLRLASKVGNQISMATAKTISKYFNVPITKYFNIEKKEVKYSKATNAGIRTILVIILGEAKRQQLVEHNYASKDYTRAITGTTKQKRYSTSRNRKTLLRLYLKNHTKRKELYLPYLFS